MRHKKFVVPVIIIFSLLIYASCVNAAAFGPEPSPENLPAVHITSVGVTGNSQITSEYILNVADTKPGKVLSRDMIQADIEEIYNQGFFSYVDVDIRPEGGGVESNYRVNKFLRQHDLHQRAVNVRSILAGRNGLQQNVFPQ